MAYGNAAKISGRLIKCQTANDKRQMSIRVCFTDSYLLFFLSAFSVSDLGICENREAQNQPCDEW